MKPTSLQELEQDILRDLALVGYPEQAWVPVTRVGGAPVLDVLVVGAGQGGLAMAVQLLRERVTNIRVIDARPAGEEGIWKRFARMHTLRTPKFIGGPDLGMPSLTFQAWFESQFGAEAFSAIKYIPKGQWQDYLTWLRGILQLPVQNGVRFCGVREAENGLLEVSVETDGAPSTLLTRKLVLAGGIETSGYWWMPSNIAALPTALRAHAADDIDFDRLRGKRVAVIGAGASAFDNAATALEHGASEVVMLCRRDELQRVQPYKVLAYAGFLRHFGSLPDADRWRVMNYLMTIREALTSETWNRVTMHANFTLLTGAPVRSATVAGARALLDTPAGLLDVDFVICGTGFETDLAMRPELATVAPHIATWNERYAPPDDQRNPRLGNYPYLDAGMAFTEKTPGAAPWIRHITCFNFGATVSFGPSGSSISAMKFAVPRAAHAIAAGLFRDDLATHEAAIRAYDTPEFPLVFARDAL
jgi:cation diffusion facilitator CzcD-associated flavoprotein CzcO